MAVCPLHSEAVSTCDRPEERRLITRANPLSRWHTSPPEASFELFLFFRSIYSLKERTGSAGRARPTLTSRAFKIAAGTGQETWGRFAVQVVITLDCPLAKSSVITSRGSWPRASPTFFRLGHPVSRVQTAEYFSFGSALITVLNPHTPANTSNTVIALPFTGTANQNAQHRKKRCHPSPPFYSGPWREETSLTARPRSLQI